MASHILGLATQVIVMAIVISVILLFLGISVLVLIHVCIVGRTLRTVINGTDANMVERGSLGSTSMSQEDIEKLPCFDFKAKEKSTGSSPVPDCAVCLERFTVGEKCRLLPTCNHSFHAECVDLWLLRTPICPICRALAADLNGGSLFGEESSRFSEIGIELSNQMGEGGQVTETMARDEVVIDITGIERESCNSNSTGTEVADPRENFSSSKEVTETTEIH